MRIFLAIIILIGVGFSSYGSNAQAENWQLRHSIEDRNVTPGKRIKTYIDIDSIRSVDGFVRYWERTDFHDLETDRKSSVQNVVSWAADCKNRATAVTTSFHRFMGMTTENETIPQARWKFQEVSPGTIGASDLQFVCDYASQRVVESKSPTPSNKVSRPKTPEKMGSASRSSDPALSQSGSGFVVSADGHVLTNYHVINSCSFVKVKDSLQRDHKAIIVGSDKKNDLSLLKVEANFVSIAKFRSTPVTSGETVVALGFPLRGLLSTEVNVSPGHVSATAGIGNDVTKIQITAPLQPGNSGGPLLDQYGAVVGIVVQKLNALKVAKVTGDIPQNVNFAIKSDFSEIFLRSHGVKYDRSLSVQKLDTQQIAALGRNITALVECWK